MDDFTEKMLEKHAGDLRDAREEAGSLESRIQGMENELVMLRKMDQQTERMKLRMTAEERIARHVRNLKRLDGWRPRHGRSLNESRITKNKGESE